MGTAQAAAHVFVLGETAQSPELGGINGLQDKGSFAFFVVIKTQQHCWDGATAAVAAGELGQTGQTPPSSSAAFHFTASCSPLPATPGNEA